MKECEEYVVLVHGYMRGASDMKFLALRLAERGYKVLSPTLPTTFCGVAACCEKLTSYLERYLPQSARVHFVGHSMGGLIIRRYLSCCRIENPGRTVLIGTPNKGTAQSRYTLKACPPLRHVLKSLLDLAEPGMNIAPPLDGAQQIGVVAGTKSNLPWGKILSGPNDGRVTVESARLPGAAAEVLLPYNHHEIHHLEVAARLVENFLRTESFDSGSV